MRVKLRPPIFVIGNPRSGTTLLRLMLTCHEGIVIPPECGFAQWIKERFDAWSPDRVDEFCDAVIGARKFETWGVAPDRLRDALESRMPADYPGAVSAVYECYAETHGRSLRRWGDKNNYYLHHIDTLAGMFPSAFFVHLVRDGRDVACSYRQVIAEGSSSPYAPRLTGKLKEIAVEWRSNLVKIRSSLRKLDPEQYFEMRYEDLVADAEPVLRLLCEALQEEFDPNMLEYHRVNREVGLEPSGFFEWKSNTLKPPIASGVGRHERDLTPEEVCEFERNACDMLIKYGYKG